eukprot:scaffold7031_cov254-Pinguiococcus_pyrenoidosus.AAC.4
MLRRWLLLIGVVVVGWIAVRVEASPSSEAPEEDARICEAGGSGLVLPLFENEHEWNRTLRCVLYCGCLVWMFLGVGIVSDTFMSAIEVITAVEKTVKGMREKESGAKLF